MKILMTIAMLMSSVSFAVELEKANWIKGYRETMLTMWCGQPAIKECWPVPEKKCKETVEKALDQCIDKYRSKIPALLVMPNDGAEWGSAIGACTGGTYATVLASSFNKKSKTCQELDKPKIQRPQ